MGDPELLEILSGVRARTGVPAMSAAVVTSRGLVSMAAIGTRKAGTDAPVTLDDLWHLGSCTKAMTSTLVARLVEQGRLSWTTTVSEVFPDLADGFDPSARSITVLHLLSHSAGLPRDIVYEDINGSIPVRAQRLEATTMGLRGELLSVPGTRYLYSNIGYIIVGAIVERVLDTDWEAAMAEHVFLPLGMSSAGFGGIGTPGEIDEPWGHETADTPVSRNGPDADNPRLIGPAGTVHAGIKDWARFVADQLRGARGQAGLLEPRSYRMVQTRHFPGPYALGWGAGWDFAALGRQLNHSGSNGLYYAKVWVAPGRDFAVLVCTNEGPASSPAAEEAVSNVIRAVGRLRRT